MEYNCTTSTNQQCNVCQYTMGYIEIAYQLHADGILPNRLCTQLCSWRSDSKQCYPGRCADGFGRNNAGTPASCQCAPGFSSPSSDCMTVTQRPVITYCIARARHMVGTHEQDQYETTCIEENNPTKFINNNNINQFQVDWTSLFHGPSIAEWPRPYYIDSFGFGVTEAQINWRIIRGGQRIDAGNIDCNHGITRTDPDFSAHDCYLGVALTNTWQHGDVLEIVPITKAGGYLNVRNYYHRDSPPIIEQQLYAESVRQHSSSITFDFQPPVHCVTVNNCNLNMLEVGAPFTRQTSTNIAWYGWRDMLSYVSKYEIDVYRLHHLGDSIGYSSAESLLTQTLTELPPNGLDFMFPQTGVYIFLLTVVDIAQNEQYARRFILFDNTSSVEISLLEDNKISVLTVAVNTSNQWQTNVDEEVTVEWKGHFFNAEHKMNRLLHPIVDHHVNILDVYEELEGQPPLIRSTQEIPNVNGTVRYQMAYAVDHDGGRSIEDLIEGTLFEIDDFFEETHSFAIPREDGDSVRLWIRAWDVMNSTATDSILIHIDSTPPEIIVYGLVNNGGERLSVHSVRDLYDISLHFDAVDYHSGLNTIEWELVDMADPNILHGGGRLTASNVDCTTCTSADCYWIPKDNECYLLRYILEPDFNLFNISVGSHDFDYMFRFTITNNAKLVTTSEFQITIDITPPFSGVVYDSELHQSDIDYQSASTVHASWQGFFDEESGILVYKIRFGDRCYELEDLADSANILATTNTFASFANVMPGSYHTTVVAYNHAMDPSKPICSDGVTIDISGPELRHIYIEGTTIMSGFIRSADNVVAFVDRNRFLHAVNGSSTCRHEHLPVEELELYPHFETFSRAYERPNCNEPYPKGEYIFFSNQNKLNITWTGFDNESSPLHYEICIGSTPEDDDIMACSDTRGHDFFLTYHPNLYQDQIIYITLMATNKAGIQTSKTIGPLIVKSFGPESADIVNANVIYQNGYEVFSASWSMDNVYTSDIEREFIQSVGFALGTGSNCKPDMMSFTMLSQDLYLYESCRWQNPPNCLQIDVHSITFDFQFGEDYCFVLKLQGTNHFESYATHTFSYHYGLPFDGNVFEIQLLPGEENQFIFDIDYQGSSTNIAAYLSQPNMNSDQFLYYGAVTSTPNETESFTLESLNLSNGIFAFENLQLEVYQKYFTVVKVLDQRSGLYRLITSDGIIMVPPEGTSIEIVVTDGIPCSNRTGDISSRDDIGYHIDGVTENECGYDIDIQRETVVYNAYWTIPEIIKPIIANQFVYLYEEADDGSRLLAHPVIEVGVETFVHLRGLALEAGKHFLVEIQACHLAGCFLPVPSDGVWILPEPPQANSIVNSELSHGGEFLSVEWEPFTDEFNFDLDIIRRYELAVFANHANNQRDFIMDWIVLDPQAITNNENLLSITIQLVHAIHPSLCLMVAIKGVSKNGLDSMVADELDGCQAINPFTQIVIDAHGDINNNGDTQDIYFDPTETIWDEPEREFTPSTSKLSGVWPSLRHGHFYWKILSSSAIAHWAYFRENAELRYEDFTCNSQEVLACGETQARFINVHNLTLDDGERYYICIYTPAITLHHELWDEDLPAISTCSNGIAVDSQAPVEGEVWIGPQNDHRQYQTDHTGVLVQWTGFLDVEVYGNTKYETGIQFYTLSIGTETGGHDVVNSLDVGIRNSYYLTGLHFEDGRPYFATISAVDYVKHEIQKCSNAFYVDSTTPVYTQQEIIFDSAFLTQENEIKFDWTGLFYDRQSGIRNYIWCIGSHDSLCDVIHGSTSIDNSITISLTSSENFADGQHYFFTVQAVNGAGLITHGETVSFIVDTSAPRSGHVMEIGPGDQPINYQVSRTTLRIKWEKFIDPHVAIAAYYISIGTCHGCSNLIDNINMGLKTEAYFDNLQLVNGRRYFTRVRACNVANLCVNIDSDGVIVDNKPPHLAQVLDGNGAKDSNYQDLRHIIQGSLVDAYDKQSGLKDMTVWGATLVDGTYQNVTYAITTHAHDRFLIRVEDPLPFHQRIYLFASICDHAGLCTTKSSNGFIVDDSPPIEILRVTANNVGGSIMENTQVWRSALIVRWVLTDVDSPILYSKLSLITTRNASEPLQKIHLHGYHEEYRFCNMEFEDGDIIKVKVYTCNAAHLCTASESEPFLVDNSPPMMGTFAISTNHAVDDILQLSRNAETFMKYCQVVPEERIEIFNEITNETEEVVTMEYAPAQVNLSWIGFLDPHSGIDKYEIRIGSSYRGLEYLQGGPVQILHREMESRREGYLQTVYINLQQNLDHWSQIYITITATNLAGLKSTVLHGLFEAIPSSHGNGFLHLVRRCDVETCESHCTCAPHGFTRCHMLNNRCSDVRGLNTYAALNVIDIAPNGVNLDDNNDIDMSICTDTLAAKWTIEPEGQPPLWYEWSVGIAGEPAGHTLLDIQSQPIWFDNMDNLYATFTASESRVEGLQLQAHTTYIFFVRAWYSFEDFAIYESDGVEIDNTTPQISSMYKIEELLLSREAEVDFITNSTIFIISWNHVFRDAESFISGFKVCLSSCRGECDALGVEVPANTTEWSVNSEILQENIVYVATVICCNSAQLCSAAYSDGIKVDSSAPIAGLVYDGTGMVDLAFSSSRESVNVYWDDFYDDESFIRNYSVCIYTGNNIRNNTYLNCLHSTLPKATFYVDTTTFHGQIVTAAVSAFNGVGVETEMSFSDGVLFDHTPPTSAHIMEEDTNIVRSSSFEDELYDSAWVFNTNQYTVSLDFPFDGLKYICICNNIMEQTIFDIEAHSRYRLSFAAKQEHPPGAKNTASFFVTAGTDNELFTQYGNEYKNSTDSPGWKQHHMYVVSQSNNIQLLFGTNEVSNYICFDDIEFYKLSETEESSQIHVKLSSTLKGTDIVATWNVEDPESPIFETIIGLGTVQGGIQIMNFESVANRVTFRKNDLQLSHGTAIYTTLKVTNAAGRYSVFYAQPVIVDITPPNIENFEVNNGWNVYITGTLHISWHALDAESDIEACWISGSTEDGAAVVLATQSIPSIGGIDVPLLDHIYHGTRFAIKLRCKNTIGLISSVISQYITQISQAPSVDQATLRIIHMPKTIFPERNNYVSELNELWLTWDGVRDEVDIHKCKINLSNVTRNQVSWIDVGFDHRRYLHLEGLTLSNGNTYEIQIACENIGEFMSEIMTTRFVIDNTTPLYTGTAISHFWSNGRELHLDWSGCFTSHSDLIFQVHVGTTLGGADVLRWAESSYPQMQIHDLTRGIEYYITVMAINMSGLYVSHTFVVV